LVLALVRESGELRTRCAETGDDLDRLAGRIAVRMGAGGSGIEPSVSPRLARVMERVRQRGEVTERTLLAVLAEDTDAIVPEVIRRFKVASGSDGRTPLLDAIGRDLTALAREGGLAQVSARADLIKRLLVTLVRQAKPNVLLVGEPGVGKSALVEALAQRVVSNEVPEPLQGVRIVAIDPPALIAGAAVRGELERRLRALSCFSTRSTRSSDLAGSRSRPRTCSNRCWREVSSA
jgi:ATP-dependent Clp protease ATP-binding subunit ClpA